jgi:type IV secretion system protein TrbL
VNDLNVIDRLAVGGAAALSGGRALAGAGMGAIRAGTAMGSAASTAYKLGQETSGSSSVGAGIGGLATAAKGAAAHKMSGAFGIADAAQSGRSAAWEAGVTRNAPTASSASGAQGAGAQTESAPAWAGQMRRDAANRTYRHAAVQSLKEGDRGGASATPDIKDKDD